MRILLLFVFLSFFLNSTKAQKIILDQTVHLTWLDNSRSYEPLMNKDIEMPQFEGAFYGTPLPALPKWLKKVDLDMDGSLSIQLLDQQYEPIEAVNANFNQLTDDIILESNIIQSRKEFAGFVQFIPIRKTTNGGFERLVSFQIQILFTPSKKQITFRSTPFKTESILRSGQWFKLATTDHDVYKITPDLLSQMGLDPSSINPNRIGIFGNGGGTMPEPNDAERIDDLEQIPIQFFGDSDDRFEEQEYFIFFAESPDDLTYDASTLRFNTLKNPYTHNNYYFLNPNTSNPLRVKSDATPTQIDRQSSQYYDIQRYERELFNILDWRPSSHGSGKRWFGDIFGAAARKNFDKEFDLNNYVTGTNLRWSALAAVVSFSGLTRFTISVGPSSETETFRTVPVNTAVNANIATLEAFEGSFELDSPTPGSIDVEFFPSASESTGWLDYIQIEGVKNLQLDADQGSLLARTIEQGDIQGVEYTLSTLSDQSLVWNLNDPSNPKAPTLQRADGTITFSISSSTLNQFIAFNPDRVDKIPEYIGPITNQNLHSISGAEMIVIHHSDFSTVAEEFVRYREQQSGMKIVTVDIDQVYNEFSGGAQDATAIRDFCRMIYERDPDFKHLLLIGDASFDMRHIRDELTNQNFVTTYQTVESINPINAYPSDDYFALLDDNEGTPTLSGGMDITVGRWPIQKESEGMIILDKIKKYESDSRFLGDWKQRICLVADDEDGKLHGEQAETLAKRLYSNYPNFEYAKVYLDAHVQESNSGGDRYPTVNKKIDDDYARGLFLMNYIGHGGNKGWAQERILTIPQLLQWKQKNGYPIIVTATCSFASFDDPDFTSAGELTLLQPAGGVVSILSTTRIVYASRNFELITELFKDIFEKNPDGSRMTLGEVTRIAKNNLSAGASTTNARKFGVFGDPSMLLVLPRYDVITSHINGKPTSDMTKIDSFSALREMVVKGYISDQGTIQSNFNGELDIKVYDKPLVQKTLGQNSTVFEFETQNNVIFRGRSSIENGEFEYRFIVPKDINYKFGEGKILYYANSNHTDAAGNQQGIIVGGTAKNGIIDDQAPKIDLYFGDPSFVSGSEVSFNPTMIADISDDYGINISGISIGHDLTAVVDNNIRQTTILNDFYQATLDKPNEGRVEYQFKDLEEGLHTLTVTAWDIANNKGEATIEFLVVNRTQFDLTRILNYPNPFTTNTAFQFEHNLPNSALDVQIDIYTISGQKIKTIQESVISEGKLVRNIVWDGLDDYGDPIGRGVYLYKLKVLSDNINNTDAFSAESGFERLVILK